MCVELNFIATDVVWNETGQSETFQYKLSLWIALSV